MYNISNDKAIKIGTITISELNYKESDIEELLRKNIDMICDEEESMLIVGKQVRNAQHGINGAENNFNKNQKIILVASDYDEQTLSAVAWLNSNNVDISCFKMVPYKINEEVYINIEKVLPLSTYKDYYVNFLDSPIKSSMQKKGFTRRALPKINEMLEWGVVKAGDTIVAKGREDEGKLLPNGNVEVNGEGVSMQKWLKELFGWSSIQTYVFAVHKETGKTLLQIREEYMDKEQGENG